jgi:hypothetical protein
MKRKLVTGIIIVIVVGLLSSGCGVTPTLFEQYERNSKDLGAALVSRIAWYPEVVALTEAAQQTAATTIAEVKVAKITGVEKRETSNYIIQIAKGLDATGNLIELRAKRYKTINKVEALCLYRDSLQAYFEEEFIGDTLRLNAENYENPDLNFTIEVTPHDAAAPLAWDAPVDVVIVQKGVRIADNITLTDTHPQLISRITKEFRPTGGVQIAAFEPHILGAIMPVDSTPMMLSYKPGGWRKVGCLVASGLAEATFDDLAGTGVACINALCLEDLEH